MLNSRKVRCVAAGRPPADRGAAPPRGRLVRTPGGSRPKVIEIDPVQPARPLANGGMQRKRSSADFFTERTLAAYLAVSDRTIRNWIRRGDLPSYKLGAARRIDPADVEDFLARHRDVAA
jgi:excisionase family DNA binding protein